MNLRNSEIPVLMCIAGSLFWAGCGGDDEAPVNCALTGPGLVIAGTTAPTCDALGAISATASGGVAPLEFSINGGDFQASGEFEGLAEGTYTVTTRDANECTASTSVTLAVRNDLTIDYTATEAGCEGSQGALTIEASGGSGEHLFSLDGETFFETGTFSGLVNGEYTVTVRDGSCEQQVKALVPSGISFAEAVSPIITTKCAKSGCHNGTQFPDFRELKNIQDNASQIRMRAVVQRSMPPSPNINEPLTDDEIKALDCWLTDGAPDN